MSGAFEGKTHVFVQWKGTDICCDFWCGCGWNAHHDGEFAYVLECPKCGQKWTIPSKFELLPAPKDANADEPSPLRGHSIGYYGTLEGPDTIVLRKVEEDDETS